MTRATVFTFATVLIAGAALAQAPSSPSPSWSDFESGEVSFGVAQTDEDTLSSKFEEYRDLPNGLAAPSLRFRGQKNGFTWDFGGRDVQERDQTYWLRARKGSVSLDGSYVQIPHNFGNNGHTLLTNTSEGVWELSDTTQRSYQNQLASVPLSQVNYTFINNMVTPSLAAANSVDLSLQRERGNITMKVAPQGPFDVKVTYFRERRVGDRAASGTSFGFNDVVELPEPLHYLTQDFGADASWSGDWGVLVGGLHYNWFENRVETFAFDNPFRVTDSTDSSAYQAPSSSSINGPSHGLMALPPDNQAWNTTLGGTFMFPKRTRVSASALFSQFTQNSTPFIPYSTNTAIVTPIRATDPSLLPADHLDGKMDIKSFAVNATSRPFGNNLTLIARARRYDLANDTVRLTIPGYARFDAAWQATPRISVPYGYTTSGLDLIASYAWDRLTFEGGYKHRGMERTFRETESTSENGFTLAADVRATSKLLLRGTFEKSSRDYDGLEMELSEDASFVTPGAPANILAVPPPDQDPAFAATYASLCGSGPVCNLRYDQANKDTTRYTAMAQLTPTDETSFRVSYWRAEDDYQDSTYGLTNAAFDTLSIDGDYTPNDRFSAYAFFSHEKITNAQRGRQSGSSPSANALDDWTSDVEDKVDSFGAGATIALVKEKWFLDVSGHYQKVDGNNDLFAPPGGAPDAARTGVGGVQDLPLYDDTRMTRVSGELRYAFAKSWSAAVGGFFEDYEIADSNSDGLLNYVPGSFFLAANDADYQAKVGYIRFTYRW